MWVVFREGDDTDKIMSCFYSNTKEQEDLMHRHNIDAQVKEWQKTNIGQPPRFFSNLVIKEFISDAEAMRRNIHFPKKR